MCSASYLVVFFTTGEFTLEWRFQNLRPLLPESIVGGDIGSIWSWPISLTVKYRFIDSASGLQVFDQALAGGGAKSINFQELAADLAQITFDYPFRIPPCETLQMAKPSLPFYSLHIYRGPCP